MGRYNRIIKEWLKMLVSRRMLPMWICLGAIILVVIFVSTLGGSNKTTAPEETAFGKKSKITVGVVLSGADQFAGIDENGTISGFECDVVRTLIDCVYPEKQIEFTSIESQLASYLLKNGEIDLAIGMFAKGVTKTQGLSISAAYYKDEVYAYVAPDSKVYTITGLQGQKILATTSEFARASAKERLDSLKIGAEILPCASYLDGIEGVLQGRYAAIFALRYKMQAYEGQLKPTDNSLLSVGYGILSWTDNSNVLTLFNQEISAMREDGRMESLLAKWGIEKEKEE